MRAVIVWLINSFLLRIEPLLPFSDALGIMSETYPFLRLCPLGVLVPCLIESEAPEFPLTSCHGLTCILGKYRFIVRMSKVARFPIVSCYVSPSGGNFLSSYGCRTPPPVRFGSSNGLVNHMLLGFDEVTLSGPTFRFADKVSHVGTPCGPVRECYLVASHESQHNP